MAYRVSDAKRWRNAPDPQGPSDSEPRSVATRSALGRIQYAPAQGARPKKTTLSGF